MTPTVFVVNPAAGSGRAGAIWEDLRCEIPEGAGVVRGRDRETACLELGRYLEQHRPRRVVAVGGDGSLQLVVDQLVRIGQLAQTTLGIVPAGTGSDLARALGLPTRPHESLRVALGEAHRRIDRIVVRTGLEVRSCLNVAAAGVPGYVDRLLARQTRGRKRYLPTTIRALWRYRAIEAEVAWDGASGSSGGGGVVPPKARGRFYLVAVANGSTFGRGMKVAPQARLDDGLLDFVLIEDLPRWQLPWRLPQLLLGRHLGAQWVGWFQGTSLSFEALSEPRLPIDLDGEPLEEDRVEFEVDPGAIDVAIP